MFEGFRREKIRVNDIENNLVVGGSGPPLLLLHGYPQTHLVWRKVATDVQGRTLPCGHYVPEETPDLLFDELIAFFTS